MSSLLTNTAAMTALQMLSSVNKDLGVTQGRISTGLKVATADQNAAVFAIAGTMRADVAGFETIQEGLGFAESAVSVARSAAESISELLKEMKTKVVQSQDGNVDRTKLQADIDELVGQISSIANSASFNGVNYLKGEQRVDVLSSLDRSTTDGANYTVASAHISFARQNLVFGEAVASATQVVGAGKEAASAVASVFEIDLSNVADVADLGTLDFAVGGQLLSTITGTSADVGALNLVGGSENHGITAPADLDLQNIADAIELGLDDIFGAGVVTAEASADGTKIVITDTLGRGISNLDWQLSSGSASGTLAVAGSVATSAEASRTSYTFSQYAGQVTAGDTFAAGTFATATLTMADGTRLADLDVSAATDMATLASGLESALNTADGGTAYTVTWDDTAGKLVVEDADGRGVSMRFEGEGFGKLGGLATLDVTSDAGAAQGLSDIEAWIQDTLDAAAALGSTQKRLGIQKDFLGKLNDALDTGIGTLVDADMTAESARLQSLQVQQQLATQALSIANQQPQNILALFR
jgi:flagellin